VGNAVQVEGVLADDLLVSEAKKGDRAEVARVLAWRKQHPDRYRETQRNLMRKRRAKLKLDPSAV
jgi:hypothetical protein